MPGQRERVCDGQFWASLFPEDPEVVIDNSQCGEAPLLPTNKGRVKVGSTVIQAMGSKYFDWKSGVAVFSGDTAL
jgi:hypothetical protein